MGYENVIRLDEFTVVGGNSFTIRFHVLDKNGIPMDLTDCTTSLKIAKFGEIRELVDEIVGTVDVLNSEVRYILANIQTKHMSGKYIYQVVIETPASTKIVPKQGCFMVVPTISEIVENTLSDWSDEILEDIKNLTLEELAYTET